MAKKLDWSLVWYEFGKWFNKAGLVGTGWRAQQNKIRKLVEAQLEKRRG